MNTQLQAEKTAQLLWTGFILMFFLIQAVIWTVAISITSSDMSHAVIANYDEQALHWDRVKQMRAASSQLNWSSQLTAIGQSALNGDRQIRLQVSDKEGQPIESAIIQMNAFHRGAAADVRDLEFTESAPGVYETTLRLDKDGKWCFQGIFSQEGQVLLVDQTIFLARN